ncbi:MAG: hypothetical protein Q8Q39_03045 [bacterium]|nr:hypothetical protein [bacterium]
MLQTQKLYTDLFRGFVKDRSEYYEALRVARMNARGKIWVVGGYVFRSLAHVLYGTSLPESDVDVIVERLRGSLTVPSGWRVTHNRYGNPKFVSGKREVDIIPMGNILSILRRRLPATIEHFATGTPLTIQSIAYDVDEQRIIGEIGMRAIMNRMIAINDPVQARLYAERKEKSIKKIIREKAESLNFEPIYP